MKALTFFSFVLGTIALATEPNPFLIEFSCENLWACTTQSGPYSVATAEVNGQTYTVKGNQNTCCQLALRMSRTLCHVGEEAQNVPVQCN